MRRLKVGDLVQVMSGRDRGKQGRITRMLPEHDRITVEGIAVVKRHQRPGAKNQEGAIIEKESPIAASSVMPIDPETGRPTRVRVVTGEDGKKVRVGRSGTTIAS